MLRKHDQTIAGPRPSVLMTKDFRSTFDALLSSTRQSSPNLFIMRDDNDKTYSQQCLLCNDLDLHSTTYLQTTLNATCLAFKFPLFLQVSLSVGKGSHGTFNLFSSNQRLAVVAAVGLGLKNLRRQIPSRGQGQRIRHAVLSTCWNLFILSNIEICY